MRLLLAVTLLLALPASASAAPALELKIAKPAVRYGAPHTVTGKLCWTARTPLAGQEIVLEGQRYPFPRLVPRDRPARRPTRRASSRSAHRWIRNHRLRVAAPAPSGPRARALRVYTLPSFELPFRGAGARRGADLPALHRAQEP
jgi:hypothetical protein